jgi:hypothetical protein
MTEYVKVPLAGFERLQPMVFADLLVFEASGPDA